MKCFNNNLLYEKLSMTTFIKAGVLMLTLNAALSNAVLANDITHLGHDYSRQLIENKAKESDTLVEEKYTSLVNLIKTRNHPEHNIETADRLEEDQKQWLIYIEAHCQLTANVYIFPSYSRMWASQFNSCKLDMNNERIRFFKSIGHEYK